MSTLKVRIPPDRQSRRSNFPSPPVDFDAWIKLSEEIDSELVRGEVIERMSAQYPHEWIFAWLFTVLGGYVSHLELGKVLGSRSAVKISNYDGRLPDILFVSAESDRIIRKEAIYGAPDVVIEIVSGNDRPGYLKRLALDYQTVGVGEIAFVDPVKKVVRYHKKGADGYSTEVISTGPLGFTAIPGFRIEVGWLFADKRPDPFTVTKQLIEARVGLGQSN